LVFGDFPFEEVLLLFEVDSFREPREGILGVAAAEGLEAAIDEATIGDVVDVLLELDDGETDGGDWEAVTDELFFEADAFDHGLAEVLLEFRGHDVGVFDD